MSNAKLVKDRHAKIVCKYGCGTFKAGKDAKCLKRETSKNSIYKKNVNNACTI